MVSFFELWISILNDSISDDYQLFSLCWKIDWAPTVAQLAHEFSPNITVDAVDCRIPKPSFHPKWFSHKFDVSGLRYELGISIGYANVVWVHGPFPVDAWSDLKIFHFGLNYLINHEEVTDWVYRNEAWNHKHKQRTTKLMVRRESFYGSLKSFYVLSARFRQDKVLHEISFHAICNVVFITLKFEISPFLFSVFSKHKN